MDVCSDIIFDDWFAIHVILIIFLNLFIKLFKDFISFASKLVNYSRSKKGRFWLIAAQINLLRMK